MLRAAARSLNLALRRSVLVGDKDSDQQAARAAGLALGIHVLTGHGKAHQLAALAAASPEFPVHLAGCAGDAVPILNLGRHGAGLTAASERTR
jgi:histidinol phosphatase-like enzyme